MITHDDHDPATAYARAVIDGRIVAGEPVRQACARHLRDLDEGSARGLDWDVRAAQHALDFFPRFLRLAEGAHAGAPFRLQPWQQFIVGSLFGWRGGDGHRRFRRAYIEVAKGNGKTPLAAGIGLYGLIADDEPGAEIYCAAVSRDQAHIAFRDCRAMAEGSPDLAARLTIETHNIADVTTRSFLRPVSSEARSLDGKRVHMALIDEVHEHPNSLVVEKMRAGTKGRRQALIVEITNAGYDRHSVCWQHHDYSIKLVAGAMQNDAWFAYVAALDPGDAWETDETCWIKANPNLGVSITPAYLREQVRETAGLPAKRNLVARLNFCEWTEGVTRWLDLERWDACGGHDRATALEGRRIWLGLDLASTTDLTALVAIAPESDGDTETYIVRAECFVPEDSARERIRTDRVPYDQWAREGWITLTPGNVIDDRAIEARIHDWAERAEIVEVAYDPWNATALVTRLVEAGVPCVPIRQGWSSLTGPTKLLETLVQSGRLRHDGNPVLRWCAANVVTEEDAAGNIKPSKARSTECIDAIVALITALARAMVRTAPERSRYEDPDAELLVV
jgi:phage terminase large subunit-like protein